MTKIKPKIPNQKQSAESFREETISVIEIILILAQQLKIILITPIILCTLAIYYALFMTVPVYTSTAKIMSASGRSGASQASGIAAQFGINLPSNQSEKQWVYPEIVKSRTIARTMLKRKFDTKMYGPQKSLLQILTYGNENPSVGLDTLVKHGINGVIGMISISENGIFYDLSISAPEPVFARDFAIALIEELDAQQQEYNNAQIRDARQFIEERILQTEKQLNSAEETLRNFRDRNRRIENSPSLQLEQERLSREVSVLIGVFTTLKQQLETTKIEEVKESDYVIVLDPPEAPLVRSKPNKRLIVILAGIVGIGLGIVLGFLKGYIETIDGKDLEKLNQIKSLSIKAIFDIIPLYKSKNND